MNSAGNQVEVQESTGKNFSRSEAYGSSGESILKLSDSGKETTEASAGAAERASKAHCENVNISP